MPYDEVLADRIREVLAGEQGITEKRMFGGLAFMADAKMAVTANSKGGLMVRVGREAAEELIDATPAHQTVMKGRPMRGWVDLDLDDLDDHAVLAEWVHRGIEHARSLAD